MDKAAYKQRIEAAMAAYFKPKPRRTRMVNASRMSPYPEGGRPGRQKNLFDVNGDIEPESRIERNM